MTGGRAHPGKETTVEEKGKGTPKDEPQIGTRLKKPTAHGTTKNRQETLNKKPQINNSKKKTTEKKTTEKKTAEKKTAEKKP